MLSTHLGWTDSTVLFVQVQFLITVSSADMWTSTRRPCHAGAHQGSDAHEGTSTVGDPKAPGHGGKAVDEGVSGLKTSKRGRPGEDRRSPVGPLKSRQSTFKTRNCFGLEWSQHITALRQGNHSMNSHDDYWWALLICPLNDVVVGGNVRRIKICDIDHRRSTWWGLHLKSLQKSCSKCQTNNSVQYSSKSKINIYSVHDCLECLYDSWSFSPQ